MELSNWPCYVLSQLKAVTVKTVLRNVDQLVEGGYFENENA